jgi:hypothetical protein
MVISNFHQLWDAAVLYAIWYITVKNNSIHYHEIWNEPDTDAPW